MEDLDRERNGLASLLQRARALHLFRSVLEDEAGRAFLGLLRALAADGPRLDRGVVLECYGHLFCLLAGTDIHGMPSAASWWQSHLLDRILADDNPFSRRVERGGLDSVGPALQEAARRDLALLEELYLVGGERLFAMIESSLGDWARELVPWRGPIPTRAAVADHASPPIKYKMATQRGWPSLLGELASHYASSGVGDFARFRAFRWVRAERGGRLEGIAFPDPVRLDELFEYELERALLLRNTEQFVAGFPANNVLLYGDRGTGKSSTVKALLHRYGDRGLRLVEVPKGLLGDFPRILSVLRGRPERFVLFVDDLSFDERETAYKELKAALEGSLEARPENVVVYATSNRRHLVQERFSDRMGGDGEVRVQDTHQEKLSLADRFGITLVFSAPDQPRYLRIVEGLVRQRGLQIDSQELRARALQWAAHQGGFSGRTARQFVDFLWGDLALSQMADQGYPNPAPGGR